MQPTAFQQGRYLVRHEISRDACGIVFLANDAKMANRDVIIRQMPDGGMSAVQMQRIAQLNHATLPSVYDLFEEDGQRYLVIEHATGQTLADIALGPRLKEGVVIAWAKQIAQGLGYLHQQRPPLAHGDLRPANIILQDGRRVKIIGGAAAGCAVMPPSRYSAPEQWSGEAATPAADIYAFGATLHHLLTGTDPNTQPLMAFAPPDVRRPDLSPAVAGAIVRALSQNPAQRFPNTDAFLQALMAGGSDQSSGDIPVIGFTPSLPVTPADGPTQRYTPSPSTPIPVPSQRYPGPEQNYDAYHAGATNQGPAYAPPAPRLPERPDTSGSRAGLVVLGVLVVLLLLGGGAWLTFKFLGDNGQPRPTQAAINNLPTTTRDEGRLVTDADRTATALANPDPATAIPTPNPDQNSAAALETSVAATAEANAFELETLYLRGVAFEKTGQYPEALSVYNDLLARDPNYKDAPGRRDALLILLSATATAEAGSAATATVAALPTDTPTPLPPTPTPVGQVVGDAFDGDALDPARWSGVVNGGQIAVAGGELRLAAPNSACFPVVRTLTETAFPAGNFDLTVTFRYSEVTPLGTGFMLSSAMPDPCGPADRAGAAWGGIWQDSQLGLVVEFHREAANGIEQKDIRLPYSNGTPDINEHTLTIQRRADRDIYILDGNQLFDEPAGPAPAVLWIGNPGRSEAAAWSSINMLSVDLRQQP